MTYTRDLLDGLARLLAAAGVATYRPDGVYTPGETAITIGNAAPAPDRLLVLAAYPITDDPWLTDTVTGVQVRARAGPDPRDVEQLADDAYDVLHGAGPLLLGAVRVQLITRASGAQIGADASGRMERTDNYRARTHRASPRLE
ncbi:minor capsid protein [Embleya sp. MST-111070]|uniref:minor capsid protein n=1 Tax=Embleya sp. MST-111070 TaxID=3398231 RepID=UPI003F7333EE